MGEIEPWMDETQIANLYAHVAKVLSVKIIKSKVTGLPAGYGFVEFESHEMARKAKDQLNGTPIPELNKTFRLNWASQSGGSSRPLPQHAPPMGATNPMHGGEDTSGDFSVYVGDLDPNVTDSILLEHFSNSYKSILSANVIVDSITKRSKKFGFVRFSNQEDSQRAIAEMNGQYLLSRPMKLNVGYKKITQQSQNPSYGNGGGSYEQSSYGGGGYGHAPAPSYPPTYSQYNDPYGSSKQNHGYGSYSYGNPDPYASSSQYGYGSYGYGQQPTGSDYYGSSAASSYPPAPSGSYDYGSQGGSYPQYPPSNTYGSTSSYPPSTSQSYQGGSTAPGYQYDYNYPKTSTYDYGMNPPPPAAEEPAASAAPIPASKEIDYDIGDEEMIPIYDVQTIASANEEYFNSLMESKGSVDLLL
ncbi:unnamed protein product [Moneuplotes crassus]|uniref:RRM domain-containing protein n=1 Tax=Euplotes crassus TaxID=5936 RepID=A0AAD1UJJ1_EUPCR|nr:unnamed protein product [Moneuplotes crassus]